MNAKTPTLRLALGAMAFILTACSVPPSRPTALSSVTANASAASHLYVADPGSNAIYRYELINGLPQNLPDETFATLSNLWRLGVDASGHIYAETTSEVYEFSKSGRVLGYFDIPTPGAFDVDVAGYTYVAPSSSQISVYAPEAYRTHGMAKPIATLTASGNGYNQIAYLASDARPRLYASAWSGIDIWNHPHRTSPKESLIILHPLPRINADAVLDEAMAFDENDRLYAGVGYLTYCGRHCKRQYWEDTDFDAISGWLKPGREDDMIYAGECSLDYSSYMFGGMVTGLAVRDRYLEAACSGDTTGVWVYHADRFGRQHAVEQLGGLASPSDVKVGP
jgi:hypothetical protein